MFDVPKKTKYLCLVCSQEFDSDDPRIADSSHPNYGGCPDCGDRNLPADSGSRINIAITWHELRILCMWSEMFASRLGDDNMLKVIYGIADRIQIQHLDQESGLTFRSDLAELSATGLYGYIQNVIKED